MTQTFGATGAYGSPGAAREAVASLVRAGFPRGSIDTWPRDGAYLVHVRTAEHDHDAALRALRVRSAGVSGLIGSTGSPAADRLLPLGLAALAGFALYSLVRRR